MTSYDDMLPERLAALQAAHAAMGDALAFMDDAVLRAEGVEQQTRWASPAAEEFRAAFAAWLASLATERDALQEIDEDLVYARQLLLDAAS